MELSYMWVEGYKSLKGVGCSFSNRYIWEFRDGSLSVQDQGEQLTIYNGKIKNIHLLLGENGSGKTSILDLLGLPIDDRRAIKSEGYFIIYAISSTEFLIEGDNPHLIKSSIKNMPYFLEDEAGLYSILCKLEAGELIYRKEVDVFLDDRINSYGYVAYRPYFDRELYTYYSRRKEYYNSSKKYFSRFIMEEQRNEKNTSIFYGILYLGKNEKLDWLAGGRLKIHLKEDIRNMDDVEEVKNLYLQRVNIMDKIAFTEKNTFQELKNNFIKEAMYSQTIQLLRGIYSDLKTDHRDEWMKLSSEIGVWTSQIERTNPTETENMEYYLKIAKYSFSLLQKGNDIDYSYEQYENLMKDIVSFFHQLPIEYFHSYSEIKIPLKCIEKSLDLKRKISVFLEKIDSSKFSENDFSAGVIHFLDIDYEGYSRGEWSIFNLYFAMNKVREYQNIPIKNMIILLDEPETHLHPEWSRKLITLISDLLEGEDSNCTYHLIISSHSPFLLSDIPVENVINLSKQEKVSQTFAGNIHTILSSSFFLENTIGEYSKEKIDEVIEYILSYNNENQKESPKYMNPDYAQYVINLIAEPLLKNKLQEMYDIYVFAHIDSQRKIKEYERRIKEIKND